ncbi:hypothetical protein DL769_005935 [Monosporascus sp. CRB-8-3]|nr:hypothetical protein DL769_005935 [Monosporascus sp. CRB-8-3]
MGSEELFTIPIQRTEAHQGGSIVCTSPAPQVYLLTWNSPPDNRLTSAFCSALMSALNIIEFGYPPGVLVTTSAISKFYSNGLDLELAISTPGFFEDELYFLWRRFLTYPMPTIALINGHCFAGGLMLAMHHDYRVFAGSKGYMCLNEIEFGMPLMAPMSSIFRIKLAPQVYRQLVLEAHRFDGKEALSAGLVDVVGDLHALLDFVRDKGLVKKGVTGVYGILKAEMYRESVTLLESGVGGASQLPALQAAEKKRKVEGTKWFRRACLSVPTVPTTAPAPIDLPEPALNSIRKAGVDLSNGYPCRPPRPLYLQDVYQIRNEEWKHDDAGARADESKSALLSAVELGEHYRKIEIRVPAHIEVAVIWPALFATERAAGFRNAGSAPWWHADLVCELQPAGITHPHNDTVPPVGGDTLWDNSRITIHNASWDYGGVHPKHGTRVTSFAEKPYFDPNAPTRRQALGLLHRGGCHLMGLPEG